MTGLALEGGGTKGAYQVGVYKALKECSIKINGITGTSIGSFNAALIASGLDKELENFWMNENIAKLLGLEKLIVKDVNFFDNVKGITKPIIDIINNSGLPSDKLFEKLQKILDEDKLRSSKLDYGLVTFRLKDNKPLYLYKEDIPKGKLVDYIVASSFLPVFKPILLDGESYYLDGAFYDVSPSNMLEEKGYSKIYVVSLKAPGIKRKKTGSSKIIKITPSRPLGNMLNVDKMKIYENIEMGYYDTIRKIKKLDGYKFTFAKKSKWLYNIKAKKVSKKTLNRIQVFFFTNDIKELIIKSLEYVMTKEKYSYGKIYDPFVEISKVKKYKKELIPYKFLKELKII